MLYYTPSPLLVIIIIIVVIVIVIVILVIIVIIIVIVIVIIIIIVVIVTCTPSPPTKSSGFGGFDSRRLLSLKGGNSHVRINHCIGSLPESSTRGLLVEKLLVGGLGVLYYAMLY